MQRRKGVQGEFERKEGNGKMNVYNEKKKKARLLDKDNLGYVCVCCLCMRIRYAGGPVQTKESKREKGERQHQAAHADGRPWQREGERDVDGNTDPRTAKARLVY